MAGPFGGTTAAVLLRAALLEQPDGVEPVALTVNYCAALVKGAFRIGVREMRRGKSVGHVSVQLTQGDTIAATASVVLARRRDTWAHQVAAMPDVPPPDQVAPIDSSSRPLPWLQRYEFRFVRGALRTQDAAVCRTAAGALHAVGGRRAAPRRSTICRWRRCATCSSCACSRCAAPRCRRAR